MNKHPASDMHPAIGVRSLGKVVRIGVFGCAGSIVLLALVALLLNDRETELTTGLPTVLAELGPVFSRRVKERFPIGISTHTLRSQLEHAGFRVDENRAEFTDQRFILFCPTTFTVLWESDRNAKLTGIDGFARHSCF